MAISPFEVSGMMSRTQDFSIYKHNDDVKPHVDQSNLQLQQDQKDEQKANTVNTADETDTQSRNKDASDKGSNEYQGDGGQNRKKKNEIPPEGRVIKKQIKRFDLSI